MDTNVNVSPRILSLAWGKMEVEQLGQGKDFKLWPGGGKPWNWSEHGTGHSRGIQIDDVRELLAYEPQVIILTRGLLFRLQIPDRTKNYVEESNIKLVVVSTKKGVQIYNEYVDKGIPVAGLFHSTC